jgi:hypothetical protein
MAKANLQTFLEDRLRSLDPTLDLSPGSPAQVQFIEPVLKYLGTDPFETDVDSFITDRFAQEFPDVFAGDPGVVRDVFIKPLILLLEPFKRETETIKRNQSLKDPTVLSDEDADALVANVFDERDSGSVATGTARVIFPNPTNTQIEITTRFFTADGLSYYPTNPISITAEEMAFNKTGTQYFIDVPVKAEKQGSEYNIDVGTLSGVDGLFGAVRVTNLSKFENGTAKVDTPTFIAQAREAMNERSLVTRRGATARIGDVFQTELRAIQVIGAKDPEMERDLLVALSPGHQWITGVVSFWKKMALVQARTIEGDETDIPVPGDTLYCYLPKSSFPALDQKSRLVRLTVEQVYVGPLPISSPYQTMYLVQWSGSFPPGVVITDGSSFEGGFSKKGNVAISSIPGLGSASVTVPNGEVHVFGHTDFYVRPILQPTSTAIINGLADSKSIAERLTLQTFGLTTEKNKVQDPGAPPIDFVSLGVEPGDLLSIETGDDIGVYTIYEVTPSTLWLGSNLTKSQSNLRYRIIKNITIDPFEPKIRKFPFASILANDLQTTIGSNLFKLTSNDMTSFGVAVGDVIRVTSGIIAGDYTIVGFDSVLGGQGLLVDRKASATLSGIQYEVFTPLEKIERPLVRIKDLTLLDSANQSTGISIPLAQPVGVVPTSNFSSARVRGSSQRRSGFVLPSFKTTPFTTYLSGGPVVAPSGDRRYSLGFDTPEGWYFPVQFADLTYAELDYRADPSSGTGDQLDPASYFVCVAEELDDAENFPPIDPKPGECLSIKNGPNKGNYIIKDVIKFKHRLTAPSRTVWTYFVKIYGSFPVDVLGQLFDFLNDVGGLAAITQLPITGTVTYPDFFKNLYNSLGSKMNAALVALGVASPPSASDLQAALDSLVFGDYDWGDPARGVLRTFFQSPTLFEQRTGDNNPTTYSLITKSGETIRFRSDTNRYRKQEIIPPRLTSDADPLEYPRDLDVTRTLTYSAQTSNFTVGKTLRGQSSGASAIIIADTDSGTTGTLTLKNIVGAFENGETIVDDNTIPGSATAGSVGTSNIVNFTDIARPSIFSLGVVPGDILSVHEEVFFHGTDNSRQTAVQTISGTPQITAPSTSGNIFTPDMVGNLLYIEQGQDAGAYRVVKFIDGKNIVLDKALTESTPTILAQGAVDSWGHDGVDNKIESGSFIFTPYIGKFITIYGMSYKFQGSYEITGAPVNGTCVISKPAPDFPGSPILHSETDAHWVITDAPVSPPAVSESGTELYALRPIRMYKSAPKDIVITSRVFNDLSISQAVIQGSPVLAAGLRQPFRIYRKDVRRVTPSEMDEHRFGQLVYFDTEVSSLSPYESANIDAESFLTVDEGTYSSFGYSHSPDDRTLTYSMKESGTLGISPRILPIGSPDSEENFINLLGSSIKVTYERSDLVQKVQEFADSVQDRVTSANILVRHFLPSYVSYDAEYFGGSAPSVIASDIINYIDNLPVEQPLDVSEIQDLISRRGGNIVTPTSVQILIHDWSRRVWLEFSANQVGGTITKVPYDGTPRVSFFIPGPDVSGQDPIPEGERINLIRS